MRIFLVRHGDADAEVPEGLGDEGRALTAKVRLALHGHFQALAPRIQQLTVILTSPLVRTVQTAQILAVATAHESSLKAHRTLVPDMPVGSLETLLREWAGDDLALVGHQPTMGALAAHLLGMPTFPKPVNPGTVIGLQRPDDGGPASLLFYAAPGQQVLEAI